MNLKPAKLERIENYSQEQILALMAEISREINGIHSLDELLEKIAELCRQFIDYQIFAILLVDDSKQDLYWRFTIGYPEVIQGKHIQFGEGLVGTAAQRREPVLVPDVTKDQRYIDLVAGVRSELAIPLISRNRDRRRAGHRESAGELFSAFPPKSADASGGAAGGRHRQRESL